MVSKDAAVGVLVRLLHPDAVASADRQDYAVGELTRPTDHSGTWYVWWPIKKKETIWPLVLLIKLS